MPTEWSNFFVMVGGGSAALVGLIFVAMSVSPKIVLSDTTHRNRAVNMLSGFTAVFLASCLALIGNQSLRVLGAEWLVLWLIATTLFVRGYLVAIRSGVSTVGLHPIRLAGGTLCYIAEVAASILLVTGHNFALYIAAIAIVILFGFLISGAWLLMIGGNEEPASKSVNF